MSLILLTWTNLAFAQNTIPVRSVAPPDIANDADETSTKAELKAYAKAERLNGTPCHEVMKKMTSAAMTRWHQDEVRGYLSEFGDRSACQTLEEGSLSTSVVVGPRSWDGWQFALQVMPSVGLGVPVVPIGTRNDAYKALGEIGGIQGGLTIRFTPRQYWFGLNLQFGTAEVDGASLDVLKYPDPSMLLAGLGVEALFGVVSLNVLYADLRDDGLFGTSMSKAGVVMFKADLTALGVTVGAAVQ